jgi:hypothetical protein
MYTASRGAGGRVWRQIRDSPPNARRGFNSIDQPQPRRVLKGKRPIPGRRPRQPHNTYLNGNPLHSAVLAHGDEIQIGNFCLVFLRGSRAVHPGSGVAVRMSADEFLQRAETVTAIDVWDQIVSRAEILRGDPALSALIEQLRASQFRAGR